ncbi:MAG TPA: hypothetical protein VEZ48_11645 [Sphingomonadaceae bacterium]|nr:hypothetical protein [Sphingomonadaceae bacterium]
MTAPTDGLLMIQSQLSQAVAALYANAPRMTDAAVARRMEAIERKATEYGLTPLAEVARAGRHAAGAPGYRTALAQHLERMDDAIGCRPLDDAATAAIMASIALRLA